MRRRAAAFVASPPAAFLPVQPAKPACAVRPHARHPCPSLFPCLLAAAPIRNVLVTSQTMDAVVAGCSAGGGAAVPGCELCVAAGWSGAGCPDPLGIMGQLCQISPGLSQCRQARDGRESRSRRPPPPLPRHCGPDCATPPKKRKAEPECPPPHASSSTSCCSTFAAMCAEAGATFSSLCSGALRAAGLSPNGGSGSGGSGASSEAAAADPLTTMYLHASMTGEA